MCMCVRSRARECVRVSERARMHASTHVFIIMTIIFIIIITFIIYNTIITIINIATINYVMNYLYLFTFRLTCYMLSFGQFTPCCSCSVRGNSNTTTTSKSSNVDADTTTHSGTRKRCVVVRLLMIAVTAVGVKMLKIY